MLGNACTNSNTKVARCLEEGIPKQERLVSMFAEGLFNKNLHVTLYLKKEKSLYACVKDAINLDYNYDVFHDETNQLVGDH